MLKSKNNKTGLFKLFFGLKQLWVTRFFDLSKNRAAVSIVNGTH